MPLLSEFDPRPAVVMWLKSKERIQKEQFKVSKQQWFKQYLVMTLWMKMMTIRMLSRVNLLENFKVA